MAKLIFTSRYIRDAPPEHLQNYVRYISTREGVEKVDESKKNLPVTPAQKDLIRQLVKDMPESKDMLEYEDYRQHPTIGNASEFITQALERNLDMAAMKENYVDYLANRPRVERIGEHGLFTDAGKPVILAEVQKEVSEHKGPVWTHVVSLRREDAARLGYDSAREWMSLLRSKRAMLCKYMKIDSGDLRWYAAFHNEGYHPHVHLMVYSAKDNDGYLTKAGIEAMRSELAHDIFRQDFAQICEGQNLARSSLKEKAAERMCLLTEEMLQGVCKNPVIGEKLQLLSERLKNTRGKKVYGYLKADMKRLVDQIVDELAKEPTVAETYQAWGEWQDQILLTYSSKAPSLPPLSSQKQLKSIKNMVIAEALKLSDHHFLYETSMQEAGHTGIRLDELEETIPDEREEGEAASADTEDRIVVANAEDPLPEPEMPPAAICTGVKGSRRILRKPWVCFHWKQIQGMRLPCMTWAGCGQMVLGWRRIRIRHRNGTGKRWQPFCLRKKLCQKGKRRTCSTGSEKCISPVLAVCRITKRLRTGWRGLQTSSISTPSIALPVCTPE